MESALIDILDPVLRQWPTVTVLLLVGWYLRGFLQSCLDHQQKTVDYLLDMIAQQRIQDATRASFGRSLPPSGGERGEGGERYPIPPNT